MSDAGVEICNARLSMLSLAAVLCTLVLSLLMILLPLKTSLETQRSCTMQPGETNGLESVMLHSQAEMVGSTPNINIAAEGRNRK